jgi:lysophospholipase L1-like esterase
VHDPPVPSPHESQPPAGPGSSPGSSPGRWRRGRTLLVVLLLLELVLSLGQPTALDDIRQRTHRLSRASARFITCQPSNYDPRSGQPLLVFDPELFWRMTPEVTGRFFDTRTVRTNAAGLRMGPLQLTEPGVRRLLFLGDSVTFGYGVDEPQRFGDQAVARLGQQRPGARWQAINAGVVGYSSFQGRHLLDRLLSLPGLAAGEGAAGRASLRLVVAGFGINDLARQPLTDAQLHAATTGGAARLRLALRRSSIVCGLEGLLAWTRREVHRLRSGELLPVERYLYYPGRSVVRWKVPRNDSTAYLANLDEMLARCREAGIPLVAITPYATPEASHPDRLTADWFEDLSDLRDSLRAWAADRAVPLVDTEALFESSPLPVGERMRDFCHPTPAGHRLIAAELLRVVEMHGLLDGPGDR